ncbi:hypothetical protein Tco_0906967 [Tanacetum coccineum]|uniref:Reverse transcriptase domain-containing protein n=1 Tax=Tanacetum coccineum TaxID=301880 RepID=A0ABQ5CJD1_9ASTR
MAAVAGRDIIARYSPSVAITSSPPDLPTEEPEDSLIMGDEHLSIIPETESDKVIKSSVENLVPIPRESEGISDDTCDVHFCVNSLLLDVLNDHFEIYCTSSNNDSFEDIDYIEASPPEDFLIIGNEELSTIPEKESDEFIKSSVEDLVPIPRESEDTSGSDSENVLHSCDDFSPISIFEEKLVTFSNPLFNSNDEFTSSDDESLSDKDVPEVKELENIECKGSYDSNLDESTFLVTPLSDSNEDEFFTPRDDVELLLHHDPSISIVSILEGFIDEPPLEENDDLFDLESKENDWKKILYDAPIDDLITEDKVFDPGIYEKSFSLTFVKLTFEDRHYFPITFVIRIFLPYLTYSVDSPFLLSSGSEDTIFDPGISTFHFSSLKPVAYENPMVIFPFFCFCPKDKGIRGESS